jgi:O-antigen/teichoic acid export membrane protein
VEATADAPHERRLALGAIAQQGAHVVSVLSMLVIVTALGRTLTLREFGVYGLALSFSTYLSFIQGSVEATAIRTLAGTQDPTERDRAFTTAVVVYATLGFVACLLIAGVGIALLSVFDLPSRLFGQARLGVIAIALGTFIGWPMKAFHDALRGAQRYLLAAAAESGAYLMTMAAVLVLLFVVDAPIWVLVAVVGSLPLLIGSCAAVVVLLARLHLRVRPSLLDRGGVRSFVRAALYLAVSGATDLVTYSLDRAVLGIFRPASVIGLYEGAVRPRNLVGGLHAALIQVVLPSASSYLATGDEMRTRELLLRGTRYVLAVVLPFTVVLMALSEPILHVWLGRRFDEAAAAMTIFVGTWLVSGTTGVAAGMLVAANRVRALAGYAWGVAGLNLVLSLALTPWLGLEGVVLGTALGYLLMAPVLIRLTLATLPVTLGELARRAWLPTYATAAITAAVLIALRLVVSLETLPAVIAAAVGGLALYWLIFYGFWLESGERSLARNLLRRPGRAAAS